MAQISTKAEQQARENSIIAVLEDEHPQSVRHVFYRMLSEGTPGRVEKTKRGYRQIQYCTVKLRENGKMPFSWIADYGREAHWNRGYQGLEDFMLRYQGLYRRDMCVDAGEVVEVWCEARGLQGVLQPICREYQVPLFPAGGYSSLSFLFEAAGQIVSAGLPVTVYHIGDYDDSRMGIGRVIDRDLQRFMGKITGDPPPFRFVRLAVNPDQIAAHALPSRPLEEVKKKKGKVIWDEVQAEAVPTTTMKAWLTAVLEQHLNSEALARAKAIEAVEMETLRQHAHFLGTMSRYGGEMTLTDADGDQWRVGDDGDVGLVQGGE